jgi:DNA-binding NarL/FixJ family response regulator
MVSDTLPIRVALLADDPLVRAGLAASIETDEGITVVAQFPRSDFHANDIDLMRVDLMLVDEGWSESDEASSETELEFGIPVLYLIDPSVLERYSRVPSYSVISREAPSDAIRAAAYAVLAGWLVIDPLVSRSEVASQESVQLEGLTDREEQVLELLAKGMTNRAIAVALEISENTVKYHVNSILSKLNAQSRTEAVMIAVRAGLIPL